MKKQYSKTKSTCKVTFSLPAEATSGASSVTLLGDFNEWKEEAGIPLKPQKDGSFKTQVELNTGQRYEFRYLVDGYRWENDYAADTYVPSPFAGVDNGVVELEAKPKKATKAKKDDLRKIEGIGPKIAGLLKEEGVVTFKDLAATSVEKLKEVLLKAGPRFKMHSPLTWPQQAQLAADGKWEELKKLQDELDGGR